MKPVVNLLWRTPLLVLHILSGLLQELVYLLVLGRNWHSRSFGQKAIQCWMRLLTHILGLNVNVTGTPDSYQRTLIVANHISWLDIIALLSIRNSIFLAKSEVRKWPVIGYLVSACGTLFIERGNHRALRHTIDNLIQPLRAGRTVVIFPEGTTTNGSDIKPFYSGLFSAAITTESFIQPVAIRYVREQRLDQIAPYTTQESFIGHLFKILKQGETHINIDFLPKLRTQTYSRIELAQLSRASIEQALRQIKPDHVIEAGSLPVVDSA